MVPTMIGMVLNHPDFRPERLASLEVLTYGASPMPAALLDRLLSLYPDLRIFQGYGMTEAVAVLTVLGPEDHRAGGTAAALGRTTGAGRACRIQRRRGQRGRHGRDRRGVRPGRQLHDRVLEQARGHRRGLRATAGTTPATPATSTTRATCSWSTG